jgi:hypothetical protein
MSENKPLEDEASNSAKNENSDHSTGGKEISNKEIRESNQGMKLNNVNPAKALQEQARKKMMIGATMMIIIHRLELFSSAIRSN